MNPTDSFLRRCGAASVLGAALLAGPALAQEGAAAPMEAPDDVPVFVANDPFEGFNRAMFRLNEDLDSAVFKPVATAYKDVVPRPARLGVTNAFANIGDAWSFVNNLLQLNVEGAFNSAVRFSVNTVLGFGGLLDIATEAGVQKHKQDFGLTMARWGVPAGPYLMVPVLGPYTVRDGAGFIVDGQGDRVTRKVDDVAVRNSLYVLRAVDKRANLLGVSSVLEFAALDKYTFTRDAYLQMRAQQAGQVRPRKKQADDDTDAGRLPPEED